jgi:hypothetical protein
MDYPYDDDDPLEEHTDTHTQTQSLQDKVMERAVRFYEHHTHQEKEKCYLVGITKKRSYTHTHTPNSQEEGEMDVEGEGERGTNTHTHTRTLMPEDPDDFTVEESLAEMSELVATAGLEVAGSTYQKVGVCVCVCVCVCIHGGGVVGGDE